jgi:hypothetical protein
MTSWKTYNKNTFIPVYDIITEFVCMYMYVCMYVCIKILEIIFFFSPARKLLNVF